MFASIQTQKLNLTKCSDPKNGMQKIEFKPSKCASNPPDSEKDKGEIGSASQEF